MGSPPATKSHISLPAVPPLPLAALRSEGGTAGYSADTLRVMCIKKYLVDKHRVLPVTRFFLVIVKESYKVVCDYLTLLKKAVFFY